MPRTKQERIEIPTEGISKKALKHSAIVLYGREPKWDDISINPLLTEKEIQSELDLKIGESFNWYHGMSNPEKMKTYLLKYVETNFPNYLSKVKELDEGTCFTMGALARIFQLGAPLTKFYLDKFEPWLKTVTKQIITVPESLTIIPKRLQRIADPEVLDCIAEIDTLIDDLVAGTNNLEEDSMADFVLKRKHSMADFKRILATYQNFFYDLNLLAQALYRPVKQRTEIDLEMLEAYPNVTKELLVELIDWFNSEPSKDVKPIKEKKPRKKKVQTTESILKHFMFQKSDPDLKIESVDPEKIIGASQLWAYNTVKTKLMLFNAADDSGLMVYRRSIKGYNEETSIQKHIRKPEEIIPEIVSMGKVALRKAMDTIRAVEQPVKERISEEVILLRVVK